MVVIDASVAAKWYLLESGRDAARTLLIAGDPIVAPEFIIAEVMNVLWKSRRRGQITADQIIAAPSSLLAAVWRLEPCVPLAGRAVEIALALDHPIYDCFYIALAEVERCELVTADDRLYRKTRRTRFSKIVRKLA